MAVSDMEEIRMRGNSIGPAYLKCMRYERRRTWASVVVLMVLDCYRSWDNGTSSLTPRRDCLEPWEIEGLRSEI